jgi:hypothetical protein|nr:hypothetical protein [Kofleriaceae bacterium]
MNITFSGLCQYLGANTPTARRAILRQQKFPTDGPMLSYIAAEQRIIGHLVDGGGLNLVFDQSHCREVVEIYAQTSWPLNGLTFLRPSTSQERVLINDVEISVKPSLLVRREDGRVGACKLFFRKPPAEGHPQLEESVAKRMASLLFYYGSEFNKDDRYTPELCSIWCVRDGEIIRSTGRLSKLTSDVQAACAEIRAIWPSIT